MARSFFQYLILHNPSDTPFIFCEVPHDVEEYETVRGSPATLPMCLAPACGTSGISMRKQNTLRHAAEGEILQHRERRQECVGPHCQTVLPP